MERLNQQILMIGLAVIDSELADTLAEKAINTVLSGLPEKAQTHDITKYILDKANVITAKLRKEILDYVNKVCDLNKEGIKCW